MTGIISKSLFLRILSAIVLIPLVLAVLYFGGPVFYALLALLLAISIYEWVTLSLQTRFPVILSLSGVFYVFLSFLAAYFVREQYGFAVSTIFLIALWASDIGAYMCGKIIGGPKMAEKISPNKTWAGFFGGIGFTVLTVLICVFLIFDTGALSITSFAWVVGSVLIAVSGQVGDLLASMLKRQANSKDSGTLIPGHGGLLDRIDSLLLATLIFYMYMQVLA